MSGEITAKAYSIAGAAMIAFGAVLVFGLGLPWIVGFGSFVFGLALLLTPVIIDGVPRLIRWIWNSSGPVWEGEILHTDSGDSWIRYGCDADTDRSHWFVAHDICRTIGIRPPGNSARQINGVPLIMRSNLCCFTEKGATEYLAPLAIENHEAKRLLVLLQNQVLRKIEKQREKSRLYG